MPVIAVVVVAATVIPPIAVIVMSANVSVPPIAVVVMYAIVVSPITVVTPTVKVLPLAIVALPFNSKLGERTVMNTPVCSPAK